MFIKLGTLPVIGASEALINNSGLAAVYARPFVYSMECPVERLAPRRWQSTLIICYRPQDIRRELPIQSCMNYLDYT